MRESTRKALEGFGRAWDELPALARAAIAGSLVLRETQAVEGAALERRIFEDESLARRAEVMTRIEMAHASLLELFRALAEAADAQIDGSVVEVDVPTITYDTRSDGPPRRS